MTFRRILTGIALIGLVFLPQSSIAASPEFYSTALYNDANLVAYYRLSDVNDAKNANHLTNNNAVAFNAGKFGNAGDTGSGNTNKSLSRGSDLGINGGAVSISAWFKLTDMPGSYVNIVDVFSGITDVGYTLMYDGTTLKANRYRNGIADGDATETVTLATSTWYYATFTYDGTTLRLYRNAAAKGTLDTSGNGVGTQEQEFSIFRNIFGSGYMSGMVDDVAVFSRALTPTEINSLYSEGVLTRKIRGIGISR